MRKQGMSWTDNLNLTRRRGNLNLHLNKIKQILLEILQKTDYYIEVPQILCNITQNENVIIFTDILHMQVLTRGFSLHSAKITFANNVGNISTLDSQITTIWNSVKELGRRLR